MQLWTPDSNPMNSITLSCHSRTSIPWLLLVPSPSLTGAPSHQPPLSLGRTLLALRQHPQLLYPVAPLTLSPTRSLSLPFQTIPQEPKELHCFAAF